MQFAKSQTKEQPKKPQFLEDMQIEIEQKPYTKKITHQESRSAELKQSKQMQPQNDLTEIVKASINEVISQFLKDLSQSLLNPYKSNLLQSFSLPIPIPDLKLSNEQQLSLIQQLVFSNPVVHVLYEFHHQKIHKQIQLKLKLEERLKKLTEEVQSYRDQVRKLKDQIIDEIYEFPFNQQTSKELSPQDIGIFLETRLQRDFEQDTLSLTEFILKGREVTPGQHPAFMADDDSEIPLFDALADQLLIKTNNQKVEQIDQILRRFDPENINVWVKIEHKKRRMRPRSTSQNIGEIKPI